MSASSAAIRPVGKEWVPKFLEDDEESSATKISATSKRQKREVFTVAENPKDLTVYVSDGDLLSDIRAGVVRVHRHGSRAYRGDYLCLRPRGGRNQKRPMLATGRPEKLFEYLFSLGVHLCVTCRIVSEGDTCSECGGK
jgi:hypothetical protein